MNDKDLRLTGFTLHTIEKHTPEKFLSKDHSPTIAVEQVLRQLIDAGKLNDRAWSLHIVNSTCEL